MMLIFFFLICFNIAQVDDDLIATEVHGSVSKNCIELNKLPNDGKNNNTYGDKIIDWNELPLNLAVGLHQFIIINIQIGA